MSPKTDLSVRVSCEIPSRLIGISYKPADVATTEMLDQRRRTPSKPEFAAHPPHIDPDPYPFALRSRGARTNGIPPCQEHAVTHGKLHKQPLDVSHSIGEVMISGPNGVAYAMTPEAATETGGRLLQHAAAAKGEEGFAQDIQNRSEKTRP